MKKTNNKVTPDMQDESAETGKNWKVIITGTVAAVFACAICLVPPALLIVMGGGIVAAVSAWLGYITIAAIVVGSVVALGFWRYRSSKHA